MADKRKALQSKPVLKRPIKLNTLQAQRIYHDRFRFVSNSLFSLSVILRVIGQEDDIDTLEDMILGYFNKAETELKDSINRYKELIKSQGIQEIPTYSEPLEATIEVNSPLVFRLINTFQTMDVTIQLIDALWFSGALRDKQHCAAHGECISHMNKFLGRVTNIEKRARNAARQKGKSEEVSEEAPKVESQPQEQESNQKVA
ncbi:hypothetical protein [Piscirickettsia litoralis]|uniref:DUF1845 domain-containing protein n=1 Tax=Piscirickettsia litoralis TaxID=1891921 RepID=A0ABX2ZZC5_9GAMM|nr:hypothetical protein [Piscirickettsia litoralis]ODN41377.1 hypothetical protein BGC07_16540 [Piscirickettsia litoralis]